VKSRAVVPYLFLGPALALLLVFFVLPLAAALLMSFTDFDIYAIGDPDSMRWVGLSNYATLIRSAAFWQALKNTTYFVVAAVPLSIATSLAAALALDSKAVFLKPLFRLGFFAPVVTTLVAVAVVWRYVYHPTYGLLNWALGALGIPAVDWLNHPHFAMPALVLLAVWKNFGYNMMIFLAALQGIPPDLSEAARLDGASFWQELWNITLPQLWPTTTFVTLMTLIGYFQFFAEPYVMTEGGPLDRTVSVVLLMYREGFRFWKMGYAAAVAFALFAIVLAVSLAAMRLQRRAESA
jgi:multiple sugar transport system permease protein